jgi:hypothetical protein
MVERSESPNHTAASPFGFDASAPTPNSDGLADGRRIGRATQPQSEVLVVTVEHLVQVRLLVSDGQVSVHLQPGPHLADEPLACVDTRRPHDVEDPGAGSVPGSG